MKLVLLEDSRDFAVSVLTHSERNLTRTQSRIQPSGWWEKEFLLFKAILLVFVMAAPAGYHTCINTYNILDTVLGVHNDRRKGYEHNEWCPGD